MKRQSLKEKTIVGVGWSAIDNVSQYAVSFIVSIILARLLSPDDYGLLGIIAIFTAICDALINAGFSAALIRKKDVNDADYNTVFIVNLFMSFLLYAVIFFCAPLIASFFKREELIALTRATSIGFVLGALGLVQQTRLTKKIDFKTQTKISLWASISSGIVGITLAILGFGVWALVIQNLCCQFLRTSLLWIHNKWIPQLSFSGKSFREMFGFGWKMMVSGIIDTAWNKLYQLVVGRFYSPASLGQYTRATQMSSLFSVNLTAVVQRVTYPVLSDIQDEKERLVSAYRRIIQITVFCSAVCLFFLGAVSEPLLYCLIGPKWHDAAVYLPLICISETLYPLSAINLNMLQVQGRSDLFLGLDIVKKIIGVLPLLVGVFVGIIPMLWVGLFTGVICYFLNSYFPGKFLGYGFWMQLKDILPSYGIAFGVAVSVWFLKYLPFSYWIILPIQLIVGIIVFFALCQISKLDVYFETKELVLQYVRRIIKK